MQNNILTIVRVLCGVSMFNLVTNKNVQCTTVQSMTSASSHTSEKLAQLCTFTMVTCHPCLALHYFLHTIEIATACQWPLLSLYQPFNVQKSRLSCRRRATISQITFGPTYSSLFGVSGSMPSVSNKPRVLAAMMAWLTCAGVAFGFWAR